MAPQRPSFPLMRVLALNAGFFGVQYSFGLQQSNMSPIYNYLGADHASLPYLWLAGPVTGLVLQPIVGDQDVALRMPCQQCVTGSHAILTHKNGNATALRQQ